MHGGEPKDHEISARNDSLEGFFRSLFSPARARNADPALWGRRYAKLSHYRKESCLDFFMRSELE
jgi:hypothetical protein